MRHLPLLLCTLLLSGPHPAHAQDVPPLFEFGWLLFGDSYYVPSHHSAEGDGALGVSMRRLYLTLDAGLGADWFGRIRIETNQSGEFETYTLETDFKDLYIGRTLGQHEVLLGLSPTPTFDLIESGWSLRYLMRTPLDLQGVASRDTGIAARGALNDSGTLAYRAMVAAGLEFGNESGDGRKWMGAVSWRPLEGWTVDFYTDYEKLSGPRDRRTLQAFMGYESDSLRWGAQYSNQDRENDAPLELASIFAVGSLAENISLVGRIDRLIEPSPKGDDISYLPFDPSAAATLFLAGLEFRPQPWLRLTPNAVVVRYDRNDAGVRPRTDIYLRFTLLLDFE